MPRYVALLRSINVAGYGRIAMTELVRSFEALEYTGVTTYIQTGNVLFSPGSQSAAALAAAIEEQLAADFGDTPAVSCAARRSCGAWAAAARTPGGGERVPPPVTSSPRSRRRRRGALTLPPSGRDELVVDGLGGVRAHPGRLRGTKQTGAFLERRLGVLSTTRNLNAVTTLCELAGRGPASPPSGLEPCAAMGRRGPRAGRAPARAGGRPGAR